MLLRGPNSGKKFLTLNKKDEKLKLKTAKSFKQN